MSALGIVAVLLFSTMRRKRLGLRADDTIHLLMLCIVGALIGAKLLYIVTIIPVIVKYPDILNQPKALMELFINGYVFYGGLIGAFFAAWIYCRKYTVDFTAVGALFAAAAPLFHVFGRIGCFLAGCCYGVAARWGVTYTESLGAPNGIALVPIQLFESAVDLLIFFVVLLYQRRWLKGSLTLYLVSYSVCRFILEFFRGDRIRGLLLGLSTSQWISAAIVIGIAVHFIMRSKSKTTA